MIRFPLHQLVALGRVCAPDDAAFHGVAIDTRSLALGQLFFAMPGERVDGHDFVAAAKSAGAAGAVVARALDVDLPQVIVADVGAALSNLAAMWREQLSARVIAITGSNGKTTTKSIAEQILARVGTCQVNAGNLNNEIGLPLSVCGIERETRFAVLEMGAGKPGDIAALMPIARPHIGLVNNVASAHLERMKSLAGVADTKGAIYELPSDGIAVINADDAFAGEFARRAGHCRQIHFALDRDADVRGQVLTDDGSCQRLVVDTAIGSFQVSLRLPGRHNARNALAATALALAAGATLEPIRAGLEAASAVRGRLNRHYLPNGAVLIDDSYNANPGSMRAAVDLLASLNGQRWLVLGDMKELGDKAAELHWEIGRYALERGIDRLLGVGDLAASACAGFGPSARHFPDQQSLIVALRAGLEPGLTVLTKGSRSSAMDRVANAILAPDGGDHAA